MRLKRRKRNLLTNIWLGLENLEVIEIPVASIKHLQYSHKSGTIYNMKLVVSKDINLLTFRENCNNKGVDRLLAYNDICWVKKDYEDGSDEFKYIKWHDDGDYNDCNNRYQSSFINEKGLLNIKVEVSEQ